MSRQRSSRKAPDDDRAVFDTEAGRIYLDNMRRLNVSDRTRRAVEAAVRADNAALVPPNGTQPVLTHDPVKRPSHYTSHPSGVECLDIIEHYPFNVGAAMKYLWRAGMKGDALEDLRKAETMVRREIARLEARR